MPPKNPAKNPTETAPETAGVFGYAAELTSRIEKEGADTVYVRVTRDVEGQTEPEFLHDYPGASWNLDTMRADFGQGRYTCTIHRRAGHGYVFRRTVAVGPAPRALAAPTPAPAPAAPAPVMLQAANGMAIPGDPMGMMLYMLTQQAQQAQQSAAEARRENSELLRAIVARSGGDPLDQLAKLAPLIQRDSTSTEALKLADQLARRYRGEERDHNDDADDGDSPLAMLGTVLAPIVAGLLKNGLPGARPAPAPQPSAPRHVPNTAPPVPQHAAPAPTPAAATAAPAPIPAAPAATDDADADEDTGPEGYTYTPVELGTIDESEDAAESMGLHPCIGSMCGILRIDIKRPSGTWTAENAAREILAWFKWWADGAAHDLGHAQNAGEYETAQREADNIREALGMVLANAAMHADGQEAAALGVIAQSSGVPLDHVQAIAVALDAIARPKPTPAPAPAPAAYVGNEIHNTPAPTTTPTPAPAKRTRNRKKPAGNA